ncbi:tripartite tricarboxylate transporter substrate binding protein [Paucibacter sp. PLA-PC-4]|uniref:Bug family tripartite tricarboxylate transporter substrate binding protein n=1 Tax=Paucibacter sp. PLA-PC-4 TaxID=2993655 RepID=UPI0022494EE4|nr:tripartite tricarboxylate transporter substrate binding protein [Paucibacter sp. PLA-PC-4]MCX2860938.1 tripartite tricarboxylate transporter substrate binding protein [Paucibacter sp. PLA-PC-4]
MTSHQLIRRTLCAALLGLCGGGAALASDYPAKPITLIVPQNAGGTNDIVARIVGQRLGETLKGTVVVENRVGAGGNIGTQLAARANKDGYTLLMTISSSQAINPAVYKSPGFDPVKDFVPIALVGSVPNVLVVTPGFAAKNLDDFLKLVKAKPGVYQYASAGNGTLNHLLGEMLNSMGGLEIQHIPYKGVAPALTDVIGGQVPMAFASLPSVLGYLKSGRLLALGVSSPQRSPALPEVPAIGEKVPGYAGTLWVGLFAPRGVPAEVERRLGEAMASVLQHGDTRAALSAQGVELASATPAQFAALLQEDIARWGKLVKSSGAKID